MELKEFNGVETMAITTFYILQDKYQIYVMDGTWNIIIVLYIRKDLIFFHEYMKIGGND